MALIATLFALVFVTELISWIGQSVLLEFVRSPFIYLRGNIGILTSVIHLLRGLILRIWRHSLIAYGERRNTVLRNILAHILQLSCRATKETEGRHTTEQEGAPADECAGPVREVGEAEEERGQGPRGPREAQ